MSRHRETSALANTGINSGDLRQQVIDLAGEFKDAAARYDSPDEALAFMQGEIWELRRKTQPRIKPVGIGELIDLYPTLQEPIIEGILRRGETANVVAASKVGKSWLTYLIALTVATGGYLFDRFKCRKGRVLVIDNELHPSTLAKRFQDVAQAMGIDLAVYRASIDVLHLRGRLMDLHAVIRTVERIEAGYYDLIIFDAWYRGIPAGTNENDNAAVTLLYNAIDHATEGLEAGWLNVHHASKGDQSGKAVTDMGAGAGSQSRAADAHIILRPHEEEGVSVLEAAVRSFPPLKPLSLRWSFPLWRSDSTVDPSKLKGRGSKQEERSREMDKEGKKLILDGISKGNRTARKLRAFTGMSRERLIKLLDKMELEQDVASIEEKIGGRMCSVYHLNQITEMGVGDE